MQRIRIFFKTEADKLKEMSFKEKRQYIWEYYKLFFGAVLILLIITYSLLDAWVFNPPKENAIAVAWMGAFEGGTGLTDLQSSLIPELVSNPEEETVTVFDFAVSGDAQYDMAKSQQFVAMLGAGELDLFIIDGEESVADAALAEYITDIGQLMNALSEIDPALYEKISPLTTESEFTSVPNEFEQETKTVKGVFAIPIQNSPYVAAHPFNSGELYMCVSATAASDVMDEIVKTLQFIFRE